MSAGTLDGDHVELLVNGENVAGVETGLHLAVVDTSGALVDSQVFGTHQTTAESDRLVEVLRAVPSGQVVMLAIKGDGSAFMTSAAMTFLVDTMGSEYAHRLDPDDSWGFIAVRGGSPLVEDYFAYEDGRVAADTRSSTVLHTSFRLRQTGDFLGLYAPDGGVVDTVGLEAQARNSSWGRHRDGMSSWCHYATPTPGVQNAAFCTPKADAPVASLDGGYYGEPITVSLGNSRVTEVRFTLDGSTPSQASERYVGSIELDATTVLRARAYRDGFNPSDVVSSTYFIDEIDEDVSLPVVSLITDPAHLWDEGTGIYVEGLDPDTRTTRRAGWRGSGR